MYIDPYKIHALVNITSKEQKELLEDTKTNIIRVEEKNKNHHAWNLVLDRLELKETIQWPFLEELGFSDFFVKRKSDLSNLALIPVVETVEGGEYVSI